MNNSLFHDCIMGNWKCNNWIINTIHWFPTNWISLFNYFFPLYSLSILEWDLIQLYLICWMKDNSSFWETIVQVITMGKSFVINLIRTSPGMFEYCISGLVHWILIIWTSPEVFGYFMSGLVLNYLHIACPD